MAIEYFQIKERDYDLVEQLLKIDAAAYGDAALEIFDLVALLRHGRVYVAVEYDEVLGSVYFLRNFDDPDCAFLYSISIVDPEATPNLATSLLNIAFADMKSSGIKSVEVNVDPANYKALKTYRENLGFVASESMQSDLLGGDEILMLQKDL
ncbi:MAG: GNAT family N-acetyltransferase [Clostridia bacterium]|nr:GNAT family N-acetyltransferase [Clostridia bacterium]